MFANICISIGLWFMGWAFFNRMFGVSSIQKLDEDFVFVGKLVFWTILWIGICLKWIWR